MGGGVFFCKEEDGIRDLVRSRGLGDVYKRQVDHPRRDMAADRRDLAEGDFEFVEAVVARLIDARRLAGRPDEKTGKEIGKTRVVVPVGDQAAQQIGTAQEGRIVRRRAAENEVIAAAGSGMAPVDHELLAGQTRDMGGIVEVGGLVDQLVPAFCGVDVPVSYTHLRAHETVLDLVCRLLLEKKKQKRLNYVHTYTRSHINRI